MLDLLASVEADYRMGDDVANLFTHLGESTSDFQEAVISSPPMSPENLALMRRELDGKRKAMNALAAIEPVGQCRFRYDFTVASPRDILLPSVDAVANASCLWRDDVAVSLHSSDYAQAVVAVEELCDVGELLSQEPFFVSQVVRIRIGNQAIDGLEQVLAFADLNAAQFTALDKRLAMMEFTFRLGEQHRENAPCFSVSYAPER